MQYAIPICWGILLLYWILKSRSVKPTEVRMQGLSQYRWWFLLLAVVFLISERLSFISPFTTQQFVLFSSNSTTPELIKIIGIFLAIAGLSIAIIARWKLDTNWSSDVDLKKDHELITTGIYAYVRHPIYTGVLLMGIGSVIYYQTIIEVVSFFALLFLFIYKYTKEEKLLVKYFPKNYPAYKKKVKALIPFVI